MTPNVPRLTSLVLGGGGLKGFAHIGVLRALEERGITPAMYAGTSIGSLIAAARAGGMSVNEMEHHARSLRKRDLFRINHVGMLLERMRSPSLYLPDPLHDLCTRVVRAGTFDDIGAPLLVNTVDVERGIQLVWGLPGLRNVLVTDAVYASCALPGFFPPGQVGNRVCIDGGTIDNLPVAIAALGMDAVIAVDTGSSDLSPATDVGRHGFAAIFMRAATTMMHALQQPPLEGWSGPPMLLIRPRVSHLHWFNFSQTGEIIDAGYEAARTALEQAGDALLCGSGVYPRRSIEVSVDRSLCIGCGTCVALEPNVMALDAQNKAYAISPRLDWSPVDGSFVEKCPTMAISATTLNGSGARTSAPTRQATVDAADD